MRLFRLSILVGLAWPVVQLVPLPQPVLRWLAPERAAELLRFTDAGVTVSPTLSLYPHATLQVVVVLAGLSALYLLARRLQGRVNWVLAVIVIAGLVEAAIGLRQYLLGQAGLLPLAEPRGTFGNRNVLAAWLVGCYGAALALPRGWPAAVLLAAATVLTMSRAGIAALVFATVVFAVTRRQGRRAALLVGVGAALAAAATGVMDRFRPEVIRSEREGRVAMWIDSLHALRRYGLADAGAGAFPYAFRRSHEYLGAYTINHPHSDYLETLVEWGVPAGLLLIGGLAGWLVQRLRRPGCLAGVAGIAVHALVDFPLHAPAVLGLVAVLAGVSDTGRPRRLSWLVPAAALFLALLPFERWNAETCYQAGAYHQGLEANPYAAPLWMELAWQAEARGEREAALRYAGLALEVEPYTHRTMWRVGNLYLRLGHTEPGKQMLDILAGEAPELTPAIALARRQTPD